ncbi:hypothetical protein MMPV_005750 [Pyropia vietnamensis]
MARPAPPSPITRLDLRQLYRALLRAHAAAAPPPAPPPPREQDPAAARRRYYDGLHELGAAKRAAALASLLDRAPAVATPSEVGAARPDRDKAGEGVPSTTQ